MIKEKKTRFNLIDLIIIIVVIACIITTVFRAAILEKLSFASNNDTVLISFCAENLTADELAFINIGDEFRLDGETFGVMMGYDAPNQDVVILKTQTLKDGESDDTADSGAFKTEVKFETATEADLYRLEGTMEVKGKNTENGFFFGSDTHIGVGKVLNLDGEKCNISIVITKITENEA